jgi:hypothetical protein
MPQAKAWKLKKLSMLLIGAGTVLPLLGIGAATAAFLPGDIGGDWQRWVLENYPNPLDQVLEQARKSDPIFETIMEVALGSTWEDLQTATGSEQPNPYEVRTAEESKGAGILTTSPIVRQRDLANLYDQESARSIAAPVLGEQGKIWLGESAERTTGLIESSQQGSETAQQLAQEAQGLSVTQDVMKKNAEMNAAIASLLTNQTQLTADNHTALLQVQRLQGIIAQLSANTSEGIDETNRRSRVERQVSLVGSSQAPIYVPGLLSTGNDNNTASGK